MGQIRELMTESPTTCPPSATTVEVAKVMRDEDVGPVPITDGEKLVGIVTDRDIVVKVIAEERDPSSATAQEIASVDLITVSPDSGFDEALELMGRHQVRRIPVVEGQRLVGIVSQADVARAADEEQTGEVVQEISR